MKTDIDRSIEMADWIKSLRWDLWIVKEEEDYSLVSSLADLIVVFDIDHFTRIGQKKEIKKFTELPAYIPAPKQLKREIEDFLKD